MLSRLKSYLNVLIIWCSRLYLFAFFVFVVMVLPEHKYLVGALLQQVFIAGLIFFRFRRRTPLFMIPDEMLACLPYFWALATLGNARGWFLQWQYPFLAVFALSLLSLAGNRRWFNGGLRQNSLLQAIYCAIVFVLLFATALYQVFPPFTHELYRDTLMNSITFFVGISVCLVAAGKGRSSQVV